MQIPISLSCENRPHPQSTKCFKALIFEVFLKAVQKVILCFSVAKQRPMVMLLLLPVQNSVVLLTNRGTVSFFLSAFKGSVIREINYFSLVPVQPQTEIPKYPFQGCDTMKFISSPVQ